MLITKKYLEGRVLQVDNCLSYAGHMNHNDLFKIQDGKFRFPHEHHGAELVQYQWPDNIPEPDVDLYKKWIISDVKFNTGVFYRTPIMHCTLPVYKNGQVRRTIQIFFDENDQN